MIIILSIIRYMSEPFNQKYEPTETESKPVNLFEVVDS